MINLSVNKQYQFDVFAIMKTAMASRFSTIHLLAHLLLPLLLIKPLFLEVLGSN